MIPAKQAVIHFNRDDRNEQITEVQVFERSAAPAPSTTERLRKTLGAYSNDWCAGGDPRATPEGVFIAFTQSGFATHRAKLQTLAELGKIEGCDWALTMHAALVRQLRAEGDTSVGDLT